MCWSRELSDMRKAFMSVRLKKPAHTQSFHFMWHLPSSSSNYITRKQERCSISGCRSDDNHREVSGVGTLILLVQWLFSKSSSFLPARYGARQPLLEPERQQLDTNFSQGPIFIGRWNGRHKTAASVVFTGGVVSCLSDETVCNFSCVVKASSCFSDSAEEFQSTRSRRTPSSLQYFSAVCYF